MTARSFTEAFAGKTNNVDPVYTDDEVRSLTQPSIEELRYGDLVTGSDLAVPVMNVIASLAQERAELRESRERAIRWAVTLEGQLARVQRIARDHREHVHEFCPAKRPGLTEEGFTVLCYLSDGHDGDCIFTEDNILGAALTGSTE